MSVRCKDCGAFASYGNEIGHKTDCPTLARAARIGRGYGKIAHGDDSGCTIGPIFDTDIVEQLRAYQDDVFAIRPPRQVDLDAANEIERLRAEVKRLGPMGGEKEPG